MKIGILTHHFIANFGAFLQAFALQEVIKKEFPHDEVIIINYIDLKHFIINNAGWFRFYPSKENINIWLQKIHLPYTFYKNRHKYMNLSKTCYSCNAINRLNLDVIIIGSDEVWNFKDSKSGSAIKFGEGIKCNQLISYAPSVGNSTIENKLPNYVISGIKRFKAISVRDNLGEQLVKYITGKIPLKVLDPTFLIDLHEEKVILPKKNYILFYYAEHLPLNIKQQIYSYAREHDIAIYGAGETDKIYTAVTVNLTPFQWVSMFKNALFVITGTFHGVALSIENKKQFKIYLTQKNRIAKVNDLLKTFAIENRNIGNDFIFDLERQSHEINYEKVEKIIKEKKSQSISFLRTAISGNINDPAL